MHLRRRIRCVCYARQHESGQVAGCLRVHRSGSRRDAALLMRAYWHVIEVARMPSYLFA